MTDKKQLNEEQLSKTYGGYHYSNGKDVEMDFETKALGQYETADYIGREIVIFKKDDQIFVVCGTLLDSYEKTFGCGTRRHVKIAVNYNYKTPYGDKDDFCVDGSADYECHLVKQYYK